MRAPESPFERYMSQRILSFAYLIFRAQSAKKTCLRFSIVNFSAKLQNIFEIGLKQYGVFVQKSLSSGAIIGDGDRKRAPFLVLGLAP